jgi:putative ATPase
MGTAGNKTTLAQIIAQESKRLLYFLSAINSGVKDIREVIEKRNKVEVFSPQESNFIDEIHRFSKSQQDSLLAAVEKGWITLIEPQPKIPALKLFLPYYPVVKFMY